MKDFDMEELILHSTLAVVNQHTISGTRMHLIAEQADISQANIHYYYKNKRNLMLALHKMVVNHYKEIRKHLAENQDYTNTLEGQLDIYIQQKLVTVLKEQEYDIVELDFWLQAKLDPEFHEVMCSAFENWREGIAEIIDRFRPDLPAEKRKYLPHMIISMLEGATLQYHIDQESFNPEEYLEFCKHSILNLINN